MCGVTHHRCLHLMVLLSLSATSMERPSGDRDRPEGWAQDVVRPVGPFWLRSLPVPENRDVAPVPKSWRQICAHGVRAVR